MARVVGEEASRRTTFLHSSGLAMVVGLAIDFLSLNADNLGVPVLAGSSAYAIAEASGWGGSLEKKPRGATRFYAILAPAMVGWLVIDFAGIDAVKMLFWSVNGALAPPLILIVVL